MDNPETFVATQDHPVYWCTRDEVAGVLSDIVDIWTSPPERVPRADGGCDWLGEGVARLTSRYAQWSLALCLKNCGTTPDDSRQCIKVG